MARIRAHGGATSPEIDEDVNWAISAVSDLIASDAEWTTQQAIDKVSAERGLTEKQHKAVCKFWFDEE